MSYVNSKLEGFAQKINPALCARVVSGVFYFLAALLTIVLVQAAIRGTLPPYTGEGLQNLFFTSVSMIFIHFAAPIVFSPQNTLRQFLCIAAAWLAAPLFFLLWGTV